MAENAVKGTIKKLLVAKEEKSYTRSVKSKYLDYDKWVRELESGYDSGKSDNGLIINSQTIDISDEENESCPIENDGELAEFNSLCKLIKIFDSKNGGNCETQYLVVSVKNFPKAARCLTLEGNKIDSVILRLFPGEFSDFAFEEIHESISKKKSQIMIYSDEDVVGKDDNGCETRFNPWFKPDWAPDDFLSYPYYGSFIVLRKDTILQFNSDDVDSPSKLYDYLYRVLLLNGCFDKHTSLDGKVGHISKVLYHTYEKSSYDEIKDLRLPTIIKEKTADNLISVIIPSKDHPDILFRCIDSFIDRTKTNNLRFEFVLVDNGSSEANKATIESLVVHYRTFLKVSDVVYIYDPKPFNFSYMCNTGAKKATGKYLLFLNDDMEIIEPDWIDKMYEKVVLPYAGAVGAKLIYPPSIRAEGDVIQHAGITNLRIGPAHKLQFESDSIDHYFGRNRFCHDMMGVTGACLLVKKSVFEEVGGFDENLAVAFNDVDLCYSIYEKGYYNIERNDVRLYHHESLSRGNDSDSEEKMRRLGREKDYLYEKHQALYGKDPFYNVNLTTDMLETEYAPKYHYEVKLQGEWAKVSNITSVINSASCNKCVRVGMEAAMDIYKWKYGVSIEKGVVIPNDDDLGFYFQGYTFVIGANNACYERTLLLKNRDTGAIYGIEVNVELRPDIKANLSDQINVDLTGYTAKMRADAVPKGNYQFGMYMKDRTSTQKLYNWSNWTLEVK